MLRFIRHVLTLMVLFGVPVVGHCAEDDPSARVKEMLHRTQEALRQAQSDNADLARSKSELEQKLQAATTQLDAAQSGAKATQAALSAKLNSTEGSRADLERQLAAVREQLAAAETQLGTTSKQLAERNSQLTAIQASFEQATAADTSCEAKNLTLYRYAEEILKRYKTKGVWASLAQKEPVFGLKETDVENVVQEYQLKLDAQKIKQ